MRNYYGGGPRSDCDLLLRMYAAAVDATRPEVFLTSVVDVENDTLLVRNTIDVDLTTVDRCYVVAAGKSSVSAIRYLDKLLRGRAHECVAIHGGAPPAQRNDRDTILWLAGGHPLPTAGSLSAAETLARIAHQMRERDLLLLSLSGGASSMIARPFQPVTLADEAMTVSALLTAGVPVADASIVRRHISDLKGGRLAALAYPGLCISILQSDVVGDSAHLIGSGLTVSDNSSCTDALTILEKYCLTSEVPPSVLSLLRGESSEYRRTISSKDGRLSRSLSVLACSNALMLDAVQAVAKGLPLTTRRVTRFLEGDAETTARFLASVIRDAAEDSQTTLVVAAGETTVRVSTPARGGRNQHLAAALLHQLRGTVRYSILCAGSDGIDGNTEAAGALVGDWLFAVAEERAIDLGQAILRSETHDALRALDALVITGPSGTNVSDIFLALVHPMNGGSCHY